MTPALPPSPATEEAMAALGEDALRPGVDALCRDLGVAVDGLSRFPAGSRPVYASGEKVLKLYPAVWGADCSAEAGVLSALPGALPAATPVVHAAGSRDGWGYLLMSRVPGVPLDTAWASLGPAGRDRVAAQTGELLAALHLVDPPRIPGWEPSGWAGFVAGRRAACVAEQAGLGLGAAWTEQIPAFLDAVALEHEPRVLLHTEIMRQHLLVTPDPWRLSGLIDFEPAMVGAREYEFASVGCFVSEGDARVLRRILTAYGYPADRLDAALGRRLLAWGLLHRYANLRWWLGRLPAPTEPTLVSIADCWFGCG